MITSLSKVKLSLSRINYKLFAALIVLGLAPTVYTTVRVFFLGQLPGEYSFSIAGQLSWVNLLYEINIFVNALLLVVSVTLLAKEGINIFGRSKLNFVWMKEFAKIGGISGAESLIRNVAYMVMVARMVNVVGEQGTYWVANNFIWGWLLLPVLQLGELIKQEIAADKENIRRNSLGYFSITMIISALWFVSIPVWKPFMTHVLGFTDTDKLFDLVMLLVGFYVLYAIQNVFDSTFYGLGKTNYMLFESVITNTIYYGIAFILYGTNVWVPTLTGIALLFGIGNAFDSIVSLAAYTFLLKKEKINILKVE